MDVLDRGDHPGAQDQGQGGPGHEAEVQRRHGPGELLAGEAVAEQGIGRRAVDRLAGAQSGPGQEHRPEAPRQPARSGAEAPESHPDGDHHLARLAVGDQRQGEAQEQVDDREGQADEEAHLGVRQAEVVFDVLQHQAQDVAVDLREAEHQGQDPQRLPGLARLRPRLRNGGRRILGKGDLDGHRLPSGPRSGAARSDRQ